MHNEDGLKYNAIGPWLKDRFGCRIIKLSLDGGFTCPNRDGRAGFGGCTFCSEDGSGTFASDIKSQIALLSGKWPDGRYLAYFQNHTNTYAPADKLRKLWDDALAYPGVVGLAVATRPDCLGDDVISLLAEYNEKTFLWVELGLQTSNEKTAQSLNRCFDNECFRAACERLKASGIRFVIHLILGLPGESKSDMLASARFAASFDPFGIKLHMLHIMKGTKMAGQGIKESEMLSRSEYVGIVCDILERLPEDITVHRLTGDAPRYRLIMPLWTADKHAVLNEIKHEMAVRGSFQGCRSGEWK